MLVLKPNFDEFKSRIEPKPERAKKAQDMPAKVRQHLEDHEGFATEDPHTRLAGSYARRTAIKDIKDVDILVFADRATWCDEPIPTMLDALFKALKDLPDTLGEGETPKLRRQRRSINVRLPESDLDLDIVPVLKTTDSLDDMLEVPDREWDEYVFTHPLGYACLLSGLNGDNGGKVVPLVKMFKHWRDIHFQRMKPKSYWLESIAVRHVARGWVTTEDKYYGEIVADLFDSIYEKFQPALDDADGEETPFVPDAKLKNHVAWNWKRSGFKTFMARLDESRGWARRAVETGDEAEAVRLWKKVFGADWFPSTEELNKGLEQLAAKSPVVTPTGRVLFDARAAGVVAAAVQAPPTRFYGADRG